MKAKKIEELVILQKAIEIGEVIYHLAEEDSLKKDYKSRDQLIGTAVSTLNNIAEGFEYHNKVQFRKFLFYAKGSAEDYVVNARYW